MMLGKCEGQSVKQSWEKTCLWRTEKGALWAGESMKCLMEHKSIMW